MARIRLLLLTFHCYKLLVMLPMRSFKTIVKSIMKIKVDSQMNGNTMKRVNVATGKINISSCIKGTWPY